MVFGTATEQPWKICVISAAQKLLQAQFPTKSGFQQTLLLQQCKHFKKMLKETPSIQIHHKGTVCLVTSTALGSWKQSYADTPCMINGSGVNTSIHVCWIENYHPFSPIQIQPCNQDLQQTHFCCHALLCVKTTRNLWWHGWMWWMLHLVPGRGWVEMLTVCMASKV